MSDFDDLEKKLKLVQEAKAVEHAITLCKSGVVNEGIVYKLMAETAYVPPEHPGDVRRNGGAERSVEIVFTVEESAAIFKMAQQLLGKRLASIKATLGL